MRNVLIALFICVAFPCVGFAQWTMQAGVGALVPLRSYADGATTVSIAPALTVSVIGYDISDMIGVSLVGMLTPSSDWSYDRTKGKYSINQATLQIMIRFLGNGSTPYLTLGGGYAWQNVTFETSSSVLNSSGFCAQGGLGYQFALSTNWKAFAEAQFGATVFSSFTVALGIPVRAGVRYIF